MNGQSAPHSPQATGLAPHLRARLKSLQESQALLAVAYEAFKDEVDLMGQQDPAIWQKVQQELDQHREGGGASFARGNFVGWTAHTNAPLEEEFCNRYTSANLPSVFGDSPLFGAVSDSSFGAANSFGADLPPLDAIPPLPSLEGSAYVDPAFISLDAASSYARSNSTSSSGPSPHLSPFNLFSDFSYASSVSEVFHSPYSSPPIGTTSAFPASFTGSGMFSEGSRSPFEEPAPPLFPGNEDTWKAQLEQIMGIPAAVGQVAYSAPSAPLARSTSTTGRAPRRGSSGREAPRFNPMAAHSTTHSRSISYSANDTLSQSAPISIGGTSAVGLANIALQMSALSTSPRSIPTSPLLSPRDALSRAGSKKRAARPLVWNESVVAAVPKNLNHIFAVHAQGKTKVEVSESSCTPLILSDTTSPDLPLARCVTEGVEYSPHLFKADCSQRNTYLFHSQEGARSFTVSFSQFGPRILPAATSFNSDVTSPIYTFIHFAPGDLVISPSHPLGSRAWWRLQECQQVHAGFPGEGHWTCRYDGEGQEKRRPVRVISHFASCPSSKGNEFGGEASWSLGRLAKAILDVLPA